MKPFSVPAGEEDSLFRCILAVSEKPGDANIYEADAVCLLRVFERDKEGEERIEWRRRTPLLQAMVSI